MSENDDLYFSFDDEEEVGEGELAAVEAAEAGNRTFLIAVASLAGLFLIGLGVITYLLLTGGPGGVADVSENEMTNQAIMTETAAAEADVQEPGDEEGQLPPATQPEVDVDPTEELAEQDGVVEGDVTPPDAEETDEVAAQDAEEDAEAAETPAVEDAEETPEDENGVTAADEDGTEVAEAGTGDDEGAAGEGDDEELAAGETPAVQDVEDVEEGAEADEDAENGIGAAAAGDEDEEDDVVGAQGAAGDQEDAGNGDGDAEEQESQLLGDGEDDDAAAAGNGDGRQEDDGNGVAAAAGNSDGGEEDDGNGESAAAAAGQPTPTSGVIVATPLGGGIGEQTPQPTGVGGPDTTLPDTGFAGGVGLAGAGLLALALVGVVLVVRRIRLR